MYVRKEAVLSSQIEGTQSSLQDLLSAEAQILDPDAPTDVGEVLNYVAAMRLGLERLNELPVSVRLLREIHARLMRGVRGEHRAPGDLRTTQNWIGPAVATLREATFVPPPPNEVAACLSDLEGFLHAQDELPMLLKIGMAHAQFETIHPFLDGNGRLGRLLISFLLCESGILTEPVLYLSHYFKRNRSEYYQRLQLIRDEGDWEGWIDFFLVGVTSVAHEATLTSRSIVELRESHRTMLVESTGRGAANALRVLEQLYSLPVTTVRRVSETLEVTPQAANNLVKKLEELGVLVEFTGYGRNRRYRYQAYVDIFDDQ